MIVKSREGDPRIKYAQWVHLIGEDAFVAWEQSALCLCGCGTQTKEVAQGKGQYKDCYSFWSGYHFPQWRSRMGIPGPHGVAQRKPSWMANTIKARKRVIEQRYVNPVALADLVKEHLDKTGVDFTSWAKAAGFPAHEHIRRIVNGSGPKRIHPKTAARILKAINEPIPPSLKEYADAC